MGFDRGDRIHSFQVPGATTPNIAQIEMKSNINVPGKYVYRVDGAGMLITYFNLASYIRVEVCYEKLYFITVLNAGVRVGLQQQAYTVNEQDEFVSVCVFANKSNAIASVQGVNSSVIVSVHMLLTVQNATAQGWYLAIYICTCVKFCIMKHNTL